VPVDNACKESPRSSIGCVDLDLFPGLGILQCNDTNVRQHFLSFVVNLNGYEIVSPSTHCERSRKIGRLKIGDEENYRASRHDLVQVIKGQGRFCAASLRLEKQDLANESQRVRPAFFWWNKKLDAICEKDEPTLSLFLIALKASRQATSAASSRLDCVVLPKLPEALTSTTSITVSSRSSVNFFTNAVPIRAVTFQSIERISSPG